MATTFGITHSPAYRNNTVDAIAFIARVDEPGHMLDGEVYSIRFVMDWTAAARLHRHIEVYMPSDMTYAATVHHVEETIFTNGVTRLHARFLAVWIANLIESQ